MLNHYLPFIIPNNKVSLQAVSARRCAKLPNYFYVKLLWLLHKAVDLCYRSQPFPNETKRIEFLFELYDKYTNGMFATTKKVPSKKLKAKEI